MRIGPAILVCCVLAILCGIALLVKNGTPTSGAMQLLLFFATAILLLVVLYGIASLASRSMDNSAQAMKQLGRDDEVHRGRRDASEKRRDQR
jgi:ABC-type transport system involved in multi-copper enzyme maturation permease subunit